MPVQLNELVVRATVETNTASVQKQGAAAAGASQGGGAPEGMVAECVEEVLRILNERHKR